MGGRAFLQELPPDSFPRLPAPLYVVLKARLTAILSTLFAIVEVPPEIPGKVDHGDIDFVVARPLREGITPEVVRRVLGAVKSIELDGHRTSNYAVCIGQGDWLTHAARSAPSETLYCQVDVKVCEDEEAVERFSICHGYGDLGIIIGAIAKSYGLSISHHGLKVASPQPNPPTHLTGSPRLILEFMGLSMDKWTKGFKSVEEMFRFAATSRFFDPRRLHVPSTQTSKKSVNGRRMYAGFLAWAQDKPLGVSAREKGDAIEEALEKFGKKSEWDAMAKEIYERTWLKTNFNGKLVMEWTGLGWRGVKAVMDNVRSSAGGERALIGMELLKVKGLVLISQKSLNLNA